MSSLLARIVAAIAAALLLTACSGGGDDAGGESAGAESSTSTDDDAATPEEAPTLPNGDVVAERAGVSFTPPEGWEVVDPSTLLDGAEDDPRIAALAEAFGLPEDQLGASMQLVDLVGLAPDQGGSLTVVGLPTGAALPTRSAIEAQLAMAGGEIDEFAEIDTPIGPAVRVGLTVDVPAPGTDSGHATSLYVVVDERLAGITVGGLEPEQGRTVVDDLVPTLATLD